MCITALLGLAGAAATASAANNATNAQTNAANNQLDLQQQVFDYQQELFAPYQEASTGALAAYNSELGLGAAPEGYTGFQATPGYQFALQQGQKAIDNSAASSGGLFSGATLKAQQEFGTGLANQEYGNYLSRLAGLASPGAAGMAATAGQNYAAGAGNAYANLGNAQAAGAIGQGNALSGLMGNLAGAYGYQQAMNGGGGSLNILGGPSWWTGGNGY